MYLPRVSAATSSFTVRPPPFLRLAGDPVRWRLLTELARSDRQVGELCARLDLPQNLVSYHLARLRSERVVRSRRSTADARDFYYALDLTRCGELLAGSGGALHPGLRMVPARSGPARGRARVLFLCTGNSARSQIAEALLDRLGGRTIDVRSAGSHPKALHPNAVHVMRERGIDIEGRRPKGLSEFAHQRFDYVITLCDRVREVCPEFPECPNLIHWSIPDPAREGNNDRETYPAFRRTADELESRIPFLLELIDNPEPTRS